VSKTSGPAHKPEKAPTQYPILKKGRRVTCLACKNGKTLTGPCGGCQGKGYIIVR